MADEKNVLKELAKVLCITQSESLKEKVKADLTNSLCFDLGCLLISCEGRPECDILSFNQVYKICKELAED